MTGDPERLLVVVNPAAGGGRAGGVLAALRETEPRLRGAEVLTPASATALAESLGEALARTAPERLLILGGDGTIHGVVNALLDAGRGGMPLGLIPAGTGSDLVRNLGLPAHPPVALSRALAGSPRPIDALRLERTGAGDPPEHRWVVNIASAGISGAVDEAVNRRPDRGPTAYLRATVPALLRFRPRPVTVRVDGAAVHDGPLLLAAFANGRCFGRGMPVAPRAEPDDGLLDVVLVPPLRLWRLPVLLPLFLRGGHLDHPGIGWRRGRRVELEIEPGGAPFDLDGETWPAGPISVEVVPGALRVLS